MTQTSRAAGWRATALAAALFAITLNFLQPLVHAALMRDAAPGSLWTVFCNGAPEDAGKGAPLAADKHDCCLGLAHPAPLSAPTALIVAIDRTVTAIRPLLSAEVTASVGIRDGPHRPRGPPAFV